MAAWTSNELDKIGRAEELDLASLRGNGTLRKPVRMWVVRVGNDVYVRAYKGRTGPWFRHTQERHEGHIRAGGVDKDVTFVDADAAVIEAVDAAYRAKYGHYSAQIFDPMVTPEARTATLKLLPR